jgi:hypothetical protein
MALPHRVVGLICELGRVESEGVQFEDGNSTVPVEEDRHMLRWHEHLCSGDKADKFERHPESPEKATHHYFANFPNNVLLKIKGTLSGGNEPHDVTTDTYDVSCTFDEDPQDNLPSWMTVWLEPAECFTDFINFTYDFGTIDEGRPDGWASSQEPESYDENAARAEAQQLFDAYCQRLRESLQPFQNTALFADNFYDVKEERIYPRWKTDTEYEDPEVEPYETQACPTTTSFICPWYRSYTEESVEPQLMQRVWYDFSFQIVRPDWGPWKITDGTLVYFPEETYSYPYTYEVWYFSHYEQSWPPDEGDYANLPSYPPYWSDEDGDGEQETWNVPRGYSEQYTEWYTVTIPERYESRTYEFEYPMDVRSNYDVKSRWKIKCDYRPDPACCGPAGKTITFGIKVYRANLKSAVPPYEPLDAQSPTTQYRNCNLRGPAVGRSGDRGLTEGRGLQYFNGFNCPEPPNPNRPYDYAYHGTCVRPIFTTSELEGVVYVSKVIGQEWDGEYDIELPSYDGKVTYIKDFWIESIT